MKYSSDIKLIMIAVSIFAYVVIIFASCFDNPVVDLVEYFNSRKKYERFENVSLIFGNKIDEKECAILFYDKKYECELIYSKSAYEFKEDSCEYFMYGVSKENNLLDELRMRSLKNGVVIDDQLLIKFDLSNNIFYDYITYESEIIISRKREKNEVHYSFFRFDNGEIFEETIIPDTIWRKEYGILKGNRIRVFDDFNTKTVSISGERVELSGKIENSYRGEGCYYYALAEIDQKTHFDHSYFIITINDHGRTNLSFLKSNELISEEYCMKGGMNPKSTPLLITEKVFFEIY